MLLLSAIIAFLTTFDLAAAAAEAQTHRVPASPGQTSSAEGRLWPDVRRRGGATNVLDFACGIPIGDGAAHTVGTAPSDSCFAGRTTLAQVAAITIDGRRPFWFLADSGHEIGKFASYPADGIGTDNPFTRMDGYNLSDAKVGQIDIAWLAIQAGLLDPAGGAAYVPRGIYMVGTRLALPIMIPVHYEWPLAFLPDDTPASALLTGDGSHSTKIAAGRSFGRLPDGVRNIPLMACGDPFAYPTAPTPRGRWQVGYGTCKGWLEHFNLYGSASATDLAASGADGRSSPYQTDGLALGARLNTLDVQVDAFYKNVTVVGDHTAHYGLHANGGVFGLYWDAPNTSPLTGDLMFYDLFVAGQTFASIGVDGCAFVSGQMQGETYLNGLFYAVYGDSRKDACANYAPMIYRLDVDKLMTEYLGLGCITDDTGFDPKSSRYRDSDKRRAVVLLRVKDWMSIFGGGAPDPNARLRAMRRESPRVNTDPVRRRRALIDVAELTGDIHFNADGVPLPYPDGIVGNDRIASLAMINANRLWNSGTNMGLRLGGQMTTIMLQGEPQAATGNVAIPILAAGYIDTDGSGRANRGVGQFNVYGGGVTWDQEGYGGGIFVQNGIDRYVTARGEVIEASGDGWGAPSGTVADAAPLGIALQGGIPAGMSIPVQSWGITQIRTGEKPSPGATLVKGSGGLAAVGTGSSPHIIGVALGTADDGKVTARLRGLGP